MNRSQAWSIGLFWGLNWIRFWPEAAAGPSGYDPLVLFKALILSQLYGLSDPALEEMLYDRLSFRRFCGLSLSAKIPDETTLNRFRNALNGQAHTLFDEVMESLSKRGITIKGGVMIDATIIQSAAKDPCGGTVSRTDPEAGWTQKKGALITTATKPT